MYCWKNTVVLLVFLLPCKSYFGQENFSDSLINKGADRNVIRCALAGNSTNFSFQYEHSFMFKRQDYFFVSTGAGVGSGSLKKYFGLFSNQPSTQVPTFPFNITGNLGGRRSYFETGFGGTLVNGEAILFVQGGYRLMPLKNQRAGFRTFACYPLTHNHHASTGIFDSEHINLDNTNLVFFLLGFTFDYYFTKPSFLNKKHVD